MFKKKLYNLRNHSFPSFMGIYMTITFIFLILSVIALFMYSVFHLNLYFTYLLAMPFVFLFSTPFFILSIVFSIRYLVIDFKEIITRFQIKVLKKNRIKKEFTPKLLYFGIMSLMIVCGIASVISTKTLINIIRDVPYVNNLQNITLYNGRFYKSGSSKSIKKEYIKGNQENGEALEFLVGTQRGLGKPFEEIEVYYLPHTKITFDYTIKK